MPWEDCTRASDFQVATEQKDASPMAILFQYPELSGMEKSGNDSNRF